MDPATHEVIRVIHNSASTQLTCCNLQVLIRHGVEPGTTIDHEVIDILNGALNELQSALLLSSRSQRKAMLAERKTAAALDVAIGQVIAYI